jgi:hypothetical protein
MIYNNSMTKEEFTNLVREHNLEVFTEQQILNYTAQVANLIKKGESPDEINVGKSELKNLKQVIVVENIQSNNSSQLVKSAFWVQPKQVEVEDILEKSQTGQKIQKITYLDTPLNRELERVGEVFFKGCDGMKLTKKGLFSELKESGSKDIKNEMRKAFPEMSDEEIDEMDNEEGSEGEEEGKEEMEKGKDKEKPSKKDSKQKTLFD